MNVDEHKKRILGQLVDSMSENKLPVEGPEPIKVKQIPSGVIGLLEDHNNAVSSLHSKSQSDFITNVKTVIQGILDGKFEDARVKCELWPMVYRTFKDISIVFSREEWADMLSNKLIKDWYKENDPDAYSTLLNAAEGAFRTDYDDVHVFKDGLWVKYEVYVDEDSEEPNIKQVHSNLNHNPLLEIDAEDDYERAMKIIG